MAGENELVHLVKFFHAAEQLKREKRKGWLDRGVKDAESVADHSFRLALMAMVFAERQHLDVCKCVKMALVHDLPEALVGDSISRPGDEANEELRQKKHEKEEKALKEIVGNLGKKNAEQIFSLWQEFEERKTKEARLVFELDRLEATFQAAEYVNKGLIKASVKTFFDYANSRLKNAELRKVFGLLMKERANEEWQA